MINTCDYRGLNVQSHRQPFLFLHPLHVKQSWLMQPSKIVTCLFLLFLPFLASAQTGSSVLVNRLCKQWRMEKLVQGEKEIIADHAVGDFLLVIHPDHKAEQGMFPEGLIQATWKLDEDQRIITISDTQTHIDYPMKILSVTAGEMVLQDQSVPGGVTIYYKVKK